MEMETLLIHLPHPKYDNIGAMAVTLAQTLGQNLGMMWNNHRTSAGTESAPGPNRGRDPPFCPNPPASPLGDCKCPDSWLGCIMEDTG